MEIVNYGWLSILPAIVALVAAFFTKSAVFALLIGVIFGVGISGANILTGFTQVLYTSLADENFIWVLAIQLFVGMMIAFFQKMGAIEAFSKFLSRKNIQARGAQIISWLLGIFVFFSEHLSPLYVGTVMRGITDKAKVSREKLAYISDSTSAPVCTIIPFSSWGVYMSSLLVGTGLFLTKEDGISAIIKMIPYNFYGMLSVAFVGLIVIGIVPDFGPMRKAEKRARETGQVYAEGSAPMIGQEMQEIAPQVIIEPNFYLHFLMPALIVIVITLISFLTTGVAWILEAFVVAVFYQFAIMAIQRMGTLKELLDTAMTGIKSVVNAVLILALAYCLNSVSKTLGTVDFLISLSENITTPAYFIAINFILGAAVSFLTGTSWGTYAIIIPIALPVTVQLAGGSVDSQVVYATIAAVMGGGCFGEHCSPLSDSTILSSLGAGSDHIDHVKTQLPYAMLVAAVSVIGYLIVGFKLT